jgi:putative sterol carrier protein
MEAKMMPRVKSCEEYFQVVPQRFLADKADGVDATFVFDLAGDGGGTWTVTVKDNAINVNTGRVETPSVTYQMKASDYVDLVNGDLSGVKAVFMRKLKVSGSIPLARRMNDFLPPRSDG